MIPTISSTSATVVGVVALALLSQPAAAQSSDDVCFAPVGEDGSIGNVSFEAPISASPLYWIASVKHDNDRRMLRQFHLFTEDRSVGFGTEESDFHGCGLALTGVSKTDRSTMIPEVEGQGDPGCRSILGEDCAAEVVRMAKEELDLGTVLWRPQLSKSVGMCEIDSSRRDRRLRRDARKGFGRVFPTWVSMFDVFHGSLS